MKSNADKTSVGLDENFAGLLCYILGFITGIVFLIIEKNSKFVKFHAWQSIGTFLALFIVSMAVGWLPFLNWILSIIIEIIAFVLWILLMYKAYQGEMYKLPIVGDFAEKQSNK